MERRTFLRQTAAAGATVVGFPNTARASERFDLVQEVGHSIIHYLDDDWGVGDLESAMSDAVDVVCYAYGKLNSVGEDESGRESGYLERLGHLEWAELEANPEAYNWILEYAGRIGDFVASLDVFPDRIGEKMDALTDVAEKTRTVTKFIPLVWSVKGILDVGCRIHRRLEADGEGVPMATYIKFFKHVALAIVNIVLLAAGIGFAYRVAFRATGGINSLLVNIVGRRIGWNAYSWLLSLVHWGIRVVFAEGFGEAINDASGAVVDELVREGVARERATKMAQTDVREVAKHADSRGLVPDFDYEYWNLKRKAANARRDALQHAEEISSGLPV